MTPRYPDPKLDGQERREWERAVRHRDIIRQLLNGHDIDGDKRRPLNEEALAELFRRRREPPVDAYTQGAGGRGSDVSDPTLASVVRGEEWQPPRDPVGHAIDELLGLLAEAAGILRRADHLRTFIDTVPTGRVNSTKGNCQRCGKLVTGAVADRLVSAYCPACRKAWERAGYPDRLAFERSYQKQDERAS